MDTNITQVKISNKLVKTLSTSPTKIKDILNNKMYLSFTISKRNGKRRWIDAPQKDLKEIQQKILYDILYQVAPSSAAFGFIKNRNAIDGAKKHLTNKLLLELDLENYFTNINYGMVISGFYYVLNSINDRNKKGDSFDVKNDAKVLAAICTYKGVLPQGAPTSPALANIITKPLDADLILISNKFKVTYSRYADDLTFSHQDLNFDIDAFMVNIKTIIKFNGFKVNNNKTRILRPHRRQQITGVVINDKLSISKPYYRNTRAAIHNIKLNKVKITTKYLQKLKGRIEWIRNIDPVKGERLKTKLYEALYV